MNVGYPGELLHFSELNDNTLRMRLTPLFGRIQRIKLNIEPEDYSGTYEIRLSQNDRQVYSKSLDAYWLAEENWTLIELDWKVKPRQEYLFEIIPHTQEGQEGFITFCTPDIGATRDVGNLIEDGEETECQVSFWITYRKRIQGKKFVFYALTWYAVMMGLGVIIYQFWGIRKGKV